MNELPTKSGIIFTLLVLRKRNYYYPLTPVMLLFKQLTVTGLNLWALSPMTHSFIQVEICQLVVLMRVIEKPEVSKLFSILVRCLLYFLFSHYLFKYVCNHTWMGQFWANLSTFVSSDGTFTKKTLLYFKMSHFRSDILQFVILSCKNDHGALWKTYIATFHVVPMYKGHLDMKI